MDKSSSENIFSFHLFQTAEDYSEQLGDAEDFIQASITRLTGSPDKSTPFLSKQDRNPQKATKSTNNSSSRKGERKVQHEDCVLMKTRLSVGDMGLGFDSKEQLVFQYCNGTCNSAVTLHDQILRNVIQSEKLVGDNIISQPCCRPTAFGPKVAFYDDNAQYQILRKYSAKKCGCF